MFYNTLLLKQLIAEHCYFSDLFFITASMVSVNKLYNQFSSIQFDLKAKKIVSELVEKFILVVNISVL